LFCILLPRNYKITAKFKSAAKLLFGATMMTKHLHMNLTLTFREKMPNNSF